MCGGKAVRFGRGDGELVTVMEVGACERECVRACVCVCV